MEPTSEQELKQLLDEGKITEQEYQELLEAIHKRSQSELHQQFSGAEFPFKAIPWQIWVIVILLGLEGISNFFMIFSQPAALIWLLSKALFIVGFIRGWKWVFVLFQIVAGIHVLYFGIAGILVTSFLNLILMVLLGTAWRYFFPQKQITQ